MRNILAAAVVAAALAGCEVSFNSGNNGSAGGEPGNAAGSGGNAAAPFGGSTRAATRRFVNSPETAISPALRQHYVDFSFDYPSHWVITPQPAGTASNYVRVAAPPIDNYEPFAFHVGHSYGSGNAETDRRDLEGALPGIAQRFGATIPDYWITFMGRDQVGPYESWTWRFSATAPSIGGSRPARVFGRGDIVLPPGATKGVLLLTLVTDRTNEVTSPAEVGETGTIKAILDSFQLGPSGSAK